MPEILQNQVLLRKSSGKTLPLLGGTCLKYIPTVFHLVRKGKKAKPGQQWFSEKTGKKQLWLPPSSAGRTTLPSPQDTKPVVALQCGEPG